MPPVTDIGGGRSKVTHHCPLKSKGNCRRHTKMNYCTAHQQLCPEHPTQACLPGEGCILCKAIEAAEQAREAKLRREEQKNVVEEIVPTTYRKKPKTKVRPSMSNESTESSDPYNSFESVEW